MLAKACAGEAGCAFIESTGADYNGEYAGRGVKLVKEQFEMARKHKKAIIFIDELDYIGKKRGDSGQSLALDREACLTQLLSEMDGFHANEGIVVMATTNRADILDPALLRAGRFGMQIQFEAPDREGREQLFTQYLKSMKLTISEVRVLLHYIVVLLLHRDS